MARITKPLTNTEVKHVKPKEKNTTYQTAKAFL